MLSNAQRNVSDYVKGEITLATGEVLTTHINYDLVTPGILQGGVKYVTDDIYKILEAGEKIKGKDILELDPKEITRVSLENGKKYKTVTYADLTAVGAASIPKKCIYEILVEGKITLFKKYAEVGGVQFVSGQEAQDIVDGKEYTREEKIEKANSKYELLIIKDEKSAKSISNIKLPDYISDNATINTKFENDEYGKLKLVLSSKIKMGAFNENHPLYVDDLVRLATEYNQ
jgi:hypothetical protein